MPQNPQQSPSSNPWDAVGTTPTAPTTPTSPTSVPSASSSSSSANLWDAVPTSTSVPSATTPTQPHDLTPAEYAALPRDQQKAFDQHVRAGRSILDPATGFLKGVGDTVNTLSGLISRVAPSVVRPQDVKTLDNAYTATPGTLQMGGKIGEGIAEFFIGDEALKGLSVAERLGLASKVAKLAEANPVIARIIGHGLTAVRGGTVTAAQQLAHGATTTEALKTGAEATALGAGTGAAIEGVSAIADSPVGQAVKNVVRSGQPKLQTAVRDAAQAGSDIASARPTVEPPVDKFPVSVEHDANGNVINADGRHRVVEAWARGDKTIPVTTKLADGSTEVINQTPQAAAKKMGLGDTIEEARDTIKKTDANQSYRAGNGQPRQPVYETPAPKTSTDMTPVKPASVRNTLQNVANDVQAKGKSIYSQLDAASGGRFQRYKDTLGKIDDQLDNLVEGVDDDRIEALQQKKNEVETSQAQMFEDLKLTKGLDPEAVKTADAHWKQSMALQDISRDVRLSTTGDVEAGATKSEEINPKVLATRLQKRFDSGRLQQALGDEGAKTLLQQAYAAKTAQATRRVVAGLGALAAAYAGYSHHVGVARAAAEAAALP
jgi:hypothetical protein